jgi:hypothetical protein
MYLLQMLDLFPPTDVERGRTNGFNGHVIAGGAVAVPRRRIQFPLCQFDSVPTHIIDKAKRLFSLIRPEVRINGWAEPIDQHLALLPGPVETNPSVPSEPV